MKRTSLALGGLATLLLSVTAYSADIPLYPTGPKEDSAFLRFVNVSSDPLELLADGSTASLKLAGTDSVSSYLTVPAGKPIKGSLNRDGKTSALDISVAPGEFATVFALPDSAGIKQVVVREQPEDFNGLKASLAFVNVDASCASAKLRRAGGTAEIFADIEEGTLKRRDINPVKLEVQLVCADANVGTPLDLGDLKAGERYSVMLLPSANGPRLLSATDTLN